MRDAALLRLSRAAGLEVEWIDAAGRAKLVTVEVQRAVLTALGLACSGARAIAGSLALLKEEQRSRARSSLLPEPPQRAYFPRMANAWAVAVQLYGLKGGTTKGFGDFAALGTFARQAAAAGAHAVAISPVHALFGAAPDHISPYAPSTRLFLNPLYAPLARTAPPTQDRLVDWPAASAAKWEDLRRAFRSFRKKDDQRAFRAFVRKGGARLLDHARFEVLDSRFRKEGLDDWRKWPGAFRDCGSAAVRALSSDHDEVMFQLFLQWRADQGLASAQEEAKAAGMDIGLVTDMAVGMDPAGSHAWSAPHEILQGLTIGAPADLFDTAGQNWGLTNFSPLALHRSSFVGFVQTLKSAMRHAGGIRLDHAMGLERLWVIPKGFPASQGVYLRYPRKEMLALLAHQSRSHRVLVVAEDLGTVPKGFRRHIAQAGLLGMRVLWFERGEKGGFLPPGKWDRHSAALSTTHDLPTLAGWWSGRDLEWQERLGTPPAQLTHAHKRRTRERKELWTMLRRAGVAEGPKPQASAPGNFVDAAFGALAATPCPLKLMPIEDFIAEREQPNIPGTIDQHPNWRRRLPNDHPLAMPAALGRAARLQKKPS